MGTYAHKVTIENDYEKGQIIRTTHLDTTLFKLGRDENMTKLFNDYGKVNVDDELCGSMEISYFALEDALLDNSFTNYTKRIIRKMMLDLQSRDTEFYTVDCL